MRMEIVIVGKGRYKYLAKYLGYGIYKRSESNPTEFVVFNSDEDLCKTFKSFEDAVQWCKDYP